MSSEIQRPLFFENQILGAADLTAAVEHSRGQEARHNRYLHLWGIAYGLELSEDGKDAEKIITLSAGVAIDGWGREIVVPKATPLIATTFSELQLTAGQNLDEAWFPVYLKGKDAPAPQQPFSTGACQTSAGSRLVEGFDITFARPGDARKDEQDAAKVADGPGSGDWKILLGFVQWNDAIGNFKSFSYEANGIARRYAGVQADIVAARGGSLELRTQTASQAKKPALVLNETGDGLLQFGTLDAKGKLQPVFSVNAKGDVKAEGKIAGAITPGSVQVQSGIVMDGVLLPLPPGIDPADIDSGKFTLHSHVTPHITTDQAPAAVAAPAGVVPIECFVDTNRRVKCRLRWFTIGAAGAPVDLAGLCDYTAIVSVPAT